MQLKVKKMPTKKTLEAYLNNREPVMVYFDIKKGEFVWNERRKRNTKKEKCWECGVVIDPKLSYEEMMEKHAISCEACLK